MGKNSSKALTIYHLVSRWSWWVRIKGPFQRGEETPSLTNMPCTLCFENPDIYFLMSKLSYLAYSLWAVRKVGRLTSVLHHPAWREEKFSHYNSSFGLNLIRVRMSHCGGEECESPKSFRQCETSRTSLHILTPPSQPQFPTAFTLPHLARASISLTFLTCEVGDSSIYLIGLLGVHWDHVCNMSPCTFPFPQIH